MRLRQITESESRFQSIDELKIALISEYDLEVLHLSEGELYVSIDNIRIPPDNQDNGIGTEVITAVQQYALNVDKPVILFAEPDRRKKAPLMRFYRRLGFTKVSGRKNYRLPRHTHIWSG